MLEVNKVYLGDCQELLKGIDDASIDLLLTDPPYGINFLSGQRKVKRYGKIKGDDTLDWLEPWLIEIKRVLKPDAHAYIFCSHHNIDIFQSTVKKYLPYKNILVWAKNSFGMGDLKGDYGPQHEFIIFCSNGKMRLNGKRTGNVLNHKKTGNKLHATEKPVDLLEFLIAKSSNEGDLVLDCFAGSGSSGVACANTGRHFILMEKDDSYFKLINERITLKVNGHEN